ncbi:bifunctional GMP synthase/glutamine amidotransferase protein [mine drainage metagenome]|uniref:GMP synthase (glutamine-hydrolyzing) n=1 Tax=mine drainage metagenome TaxID=410659 RepID=T1BMY7_9ZZZZ
MAAKDTFPDARETILVLDYGGQYCHLIARVVRESGVYSEIVPFSITAAEISAMRNVKGIILSGGPQSVYEAGAPPLGRGILELGLPILGICYGHQLIAKSVGGRVERARKKEFGDTNIFIDRPAGILRGLGKSIGAWMSHGDTVLGMPKGYEVTAHSANTPVAAFMHRRKPIFGVQWHPEVVQTEHGAATIRNFVVDVCGCKSSWKIGSFAKRSVDEIKATVGKGRCIVALSGGVDSGVAAALVGKAVGKHLTAVYVDTGLMREGETDEVERAFGSTGIDFCTIRAKERFFRALKGVRDPEEKRRVIGREFARVFEEEAKKVNADFLVQGTIYPDRVESGTTGKSAVIKTHHNVGGLPKGIKFKAVVEPLRDLYKDEVRKLADELGLPKAIARRQPFPGPGLAVRIMGEVTGEKAETVRRADHIVTEELEGAGIAEGLWQYFAVITGTRAVGVKGDARAYGDVIALRALESRDAMTAKFAELPWQLVRRISTRITNEVPGVTRVVYDVTDKPPGTIEWE